ncbi:hypothetical protein GCM10022254_64470 [Actinomadura meridiana]|uniref:histidine kinase n=1 Tax=Actinomadura meridiana TaxID=559626 RepID=A0ABP8CK56_9ACTN
MKGVLMGRYDIRLRPRTIRGRDTLITAAVAVLVLSLLAIALDKITRSERHDTAVAHTELAARRVATAVRQGTLLHPIPEGASGVRYLQVVGADRRVLDASVPAGGWPPISKVVPSPNNRVQEFTECDVMGMGCLTVVAIRVSPDRDSVVIYAGSQQPTILAGLYLELLLACGVLALSALASWAAWRIVGRTLRPVDNIRRELAEIGGGDLSRRVPEPSGDDEVARLARTANATLDRLERSIRRQERFASDAAHELRTPIAALRINLEDLFMHPDDTDVERTAQAAIGATDRLQSLVTDLLLLAQIGSRAETVEPLNLTTLVEGETRARRQLLNSGQDPIVLGTRLAPDIHVSGTRTYLERLVNNLLDNAQQHAATTIDVQLTSGETSSLLTVSDDGPGIPRSDRGRIFERFTRLDTARSRDEGGTGLGLAIAYEIASAHNGSLTVDDTPSGTRFALRLPLPDTPPASR